MACARCSGGSSSSCACAFTSVEDVVGATLIDALAPAIDCARDLYTSLGLRTYQVNLVWTRWSGGERGVGQETVLAVETLLPTPKLSGLGAVAIELKELGSSEQGSVTLSEISLRYSEDLLMGRGGPLPLGEPIPFDVQFYWELALPVGDGTAIRRRLTPNGVPERSGGKLQWSIQLNETEGRRARDGGIE